MTELFRNNSPGALTREQAVALMKNRLASSAVPQEIPPHVNSFFDAHRERIAGLADEMQVPPNFLLGLSADESGWGRTKGGNNLFGFSANEQPLDYANPDASIDAFRKSQWYSRLQGKKEMSDFVGELLNDQDGKK